MPACPVSIRRFAAGALLAVVLLSTGCASDSDSAASSTSSSQVTTSTSESPREQTTSTTGATTTAPVSEEDAILAAVEGYWRTVRAANDPPDPNHPDITRFTEDPARQVLMENLAEMASLGQTVRLSDPSQYDHQLSLVESTGEEATVTDCSVDDTLLIDAASGVVLNDAVVTNQYRIGLVVRGDSWRVSEVITEDTWQGVAGCAA